MSSKKEIIDDLKKFNKDLDKHFPNLDLDSLNSIRGASKSNNENDEYFSILANNLMDLRTEMALTRKNLSADVEGMVLRTIQEQQTLFFDQIKKFYGVIIMEMKDNFSGHVQMMSEDLNNLKRKYGDVAMQTQSINHIVEEMSGELKKLSMTAEDTQDRVGNLDTSMKMRIDALYEKMKLIDGELGRMKKAVGENSDFIDKKIKLFDTKLRDMKEDEDLKDFTMLVNQRSIPVEEMEGDSFRIKSPLRDVLDGVEENDIREARLRSPMRDVFENLEEKKTKERKAKMEEIDKKLQKLSSMKAQYRKEE